MTDSVASSSQSRMHVIASWLSVLTGIIMGANAVLQFLWAPTLWSGSLFTVLSVVSFATAAVTHPASRRRVTGRATTEE